MLVQGDVFTHETLGEVQVKSVNKSEDGYRYYVTSVEVTDNDNNWVIREPKFVPVSRWPASRDLSLKTG